MKKLWDRKFFLFVLGIAVPIMVQNAITNFVALLDNIMIGQLGTEEMSGVAIINQLLFVFNVTLFGACAGAGIFTSQFHGSGNPDGVRQTFRYKLLLGGILLFSLTTIFQLVTLPVEFKASARAIETIDGQMLLDSDELPGAKKVLRAAAMTYVAALLMSALQLLRFVLIFLGRNNRGGGRD